MNKLIFFLKPNLLKMILLILSLLFVLFIHAKFSTPDDNALENWKRPAEEGIVTRFILSILIFPMFILSTKWGTEKNVVIILGVTVIYIYILSCIIYFVLSWLKNKLKRKVGTDQAGSN